MTADPALLPAVLPPAVAALRRSPLGHRAADFQRASGPAVTIAEVPFLSLVTLRVHPGSDAARLVEAALGLPLPAAGRASASPPHQVRGAAWIGPDEWLVAGPDGDAPTIVAAAEAALGGGHGTAVDVSADRAVLALHGPAARDVLQSGMTIDLHPRAFGPGQAAATTLARTRAVLWQTEAPAPAGESAAGSGPAYLLLVRASVAGYTADWLLDALQDAG